MAKKRAIWGINNSKMTTLMFLWSIYKQFFRHRLQALVESYVSKLMKMVSSVVQIKFNEYNGEGLKRSEAYNSIRNYLSSKSTASANRLKANEEDKTLLLSMDDNEAVEDEFEGVRVKWSSSVRKSEKQANTKGFEERRYLTLSFNNRHREMITKSYLDHVLREGREIGLKKRERKLYTNSSQELFSWRARNWSSVPFNHPATFETLAMDPKKKEEVMNDLMKFSNGKDYYKKVGKPWKRGYLLFGPPGTGKSTMISAIANFLNYDVYDLELTTVKDNSDLKRLLLDTKGKSIVVIEDIDCSLGLKRKKKKKEEGDEKNKKEKSLGFEDKSRVTLSGLLNGIDGLWSACSDEKIMVLTTNFVEKLDPALIRRGRMDNHIEMSYCKFEAFKVLAKNYLEIEWHCMYGEIEMLLEEVDMSPADVAETLMPKCDEEDADVCIKRLVKTLEEEKEKVKKVCEEEEKKKAEKEMKKTEEAEQSKV